MESSPVPDTSSGASENRLRNLVIAIAAIALTAALFFGFQTQQNGASLAAVAQAATPLESALASNKPSVVEFYADWCTSCQSMAADNMALQKQYSSNVNFVMLNVDNTKWLPEITRFKVDGIPHFVFLDRSNMTIGNAIGVVPHEIMAENIDAMIANKALPHNRLESDRISPFTGPMPADTTQPRSHA
ncbi:MAG: thioredoxin fold domain-containing protein [Pseudanabaena sp. CRU_2_10]|nr:thioredoxin fold domain-containing protein [Pseudanabaena sp. CRU_2_10]